MLSPIYLSVRQSISLSVRHTGGSQVLAVNN